MGFNYLLPNNYNINIKNKTFKEKIDLLTLN